MPAGVVAQIQGHKPSATAEKHDRRRPIDLAWMLEQAGIEQPSASEEPDVVRAISLRRASKQERNLYASWQEAH